MFRLVKQSFKFTITVKLFTDDVIKNACDVIKLIYAIFGLEPNS